MKRCSERRPSGPAVPCPGKPTRSPICCKKLSRKSIASNLYRIAGGGGTGLSRCGFVYLCKGTHPGVAGGLPSGVFDRSGQPGCGKISRARIEAAAHARKAKLKRIVVTGSLPEEGKSLIAANLALNQSRSKVLHTVLIDGDLRRPELGSRFGFNRNLPGLSEVLRGERQLPEVVYKLQGSVSGSFPLA